jgi:hypothetical protein
MMRFLAKTNIKKGADMKRVLQVNEKNKVKKAKAARSFHRAKGIRALDMERAIRPISWYSSNG